MKICASSKLVCTQRPVPVLVRSNRAIMMPSASRLPALKSAIGMPTRTGPWPGRPVIDISPPMPCAIWSTPARLPHERRVPDRILQVEPHPPLIAMEVLEIEAVAVADGLLAVGEWWLDLD